jgi:lysophospholipase L1-like esterase
MSNSKHSGTRTVLINLLVFGVLLALIIVIGELLLRLFIPKIDYRGISRLASSPIAYEMIPNINVEREGVKISTNSDGFRDTDFSGEPRPDQFVIAVLGDSFTFGQGVPQSETFPAVLQKLLNQSHDAQKFRVWNLGVSGYNTEQESYLLKSFVLPRKPNWVVVGLNLNDYEPIVVDNTVGGREEPGDGSVLNRLINFFLEDLLITQVVKLKVGNLIRIFDPNWTNTPYFQEISNEYLKPSGGWANMAMLLQNMKNEADAEGVGFTIAVLPAMLDFQNYLLEEVNDVIVNFCKNHNIDYVDLLPYFKAESAGNWNVSSIDTHPNSRAQRIFAKALADHFNEKVMKRDQ